MRGYALARRVALVLGVATAAACARDAPQAFRGTGLEAAALSPDETAAVYRAALRGSFNLDDPTLWILADTLLLPRGHGLAGGTPVPAELLSELRRRGVIRGTCTVPVTKSRDPLVCRAGRSGYAVRFSEPYALGPDSVQVHVVIEQYATPTGPRAERMRFERAYHVARRGEAWRAVREARMPAP